MHLFFDTRLGKDSSEVRCALIKRDTGGEHGKQKYSVLFVTGYATQLKFRRIGIGWIQRHFILSKLW